MGSTIRSACAFFLAATLLNAPVSRVQETKLLVIPSGEVLQTDWHVTEVSFNESLIGTTAILKVTNISHSVLTGAFWYGEFFDSEGRPCFSAVFSQHGNPVKDGPIHPGEARDVYSQSAALFPASRPVTVRLHLLQQGTRGGADFFTDPSLAVKAPPISNGSLDANNIEVRLGTAARSNDQSFQDLALLKIRTDENGRVDDVQMLNIAGEDVESWITNFVRHDLHFYPGTINDQPAPTDLLVLVQKSPIQDDIPGSFVPPADDPWVKSAAETRGTNGKGPLPSVLLIWVSRPAREVKSMAGVTIQQSPLRDDVFQVKSWTSDWSISAFRFVTDPSRPRETNRILNVPARQ